MHVSVIHLKLETININTLFRIIEIDITRKAIAVVDDLLIPAQQLIRTCKLLHHVLCMSCQD